MTSIPASRSARAMIFAPRSCPSSPGLATTTRIRGLVTADTRARGVDHGEPERQRRNEPLRLDLLASREQVGPALGDGPRGPRDDPRHGLSPQVVKRTRWQASEDRGLGVGAPDGLKGVNDLALAGVGPRCVE